MGTLQITRWIGIKQLQLIVPSKIRPCLRDQEEEVDAEKGLMAGEGMSHFLVQLTHLCPFILLTEVTISTAGK